MIYYLLLSSIYILLPNQLQFQCYFAFQHPFQGHQHLQKWVRKSSHLWKRAKGPLRQDIAPLHECIQYVTVLCCWVFPFDLRKGHKLHRINLGLETAHILEKSSDLIPFSHHHVLRESSTGLFGPSLGSIQIQRSRFNLVNSGFQSIRHQCSDQTMLIL